MRFASGGRAGGHDPQLQPTTFPFHLIMKAFILLAAAMCLAFGLGACERHSWDSTKRLFPPPEQAGQAGDETAIDSDAGDDATDDDTGASADEGGERDTSVLPD